jgi:hypothetical protein
VYAVVPNGHKEAITMTTTNDAPKAKKAKATKKTAKPTWTLTECALAYLESLKAAHKSESTISAYAADLDLATEVLGGETPIAAITPADVERFNASSPVTTTKSGRAKAQPTIDRSRRVLRLALVFAEQQGAIEAAPIAEKPKRAKEEPATEPAKAKRGKKSAEPADESAPVTEDAPAEASA